MRADIGAGKTGLCPKRWVEKARRYFCAGRMMARTSLTISVGEA